MLKPGHVHVQGWKKYRLQSITILKITDIMDV